VSRAQADELGKRAAAVVEGVIRELRATPDVSAAGISAVVGVGARM
jgi:hypothetical protein